MSLAVSLLQLPVLFLLASVIAASMVGTQAWSQVVYAELSPVDRVRADAILRDQAERDAKTWAELEELRDKLLRTPPLAPEHNPLFGQWKVVGRPRKAGELADAFDSLVNLERSKCEFLFGPDSLTEFRARDWASIDSFGNDSLGTIQYRGGAKQVWMIPDKSISSGMMFFSFEFLDPNRVSVLTPTVNGDCILNRVGGTGPAAPPAHASGTAPPSMPAGASSPPVPTRPSNEVCAQTFLDKLGVATFNPVRQAVEVRYMQTLQSAVPNAGLTRLDARGSACDDPRINAVYYDFNAEGVLQAITYVWARPAGPAPAAIFNERVKTLSIFHKLPAPTAPGHLQADTSLGKLTLQEMPESGVLLESYAIPR